MVGQTMQVFPRVKLTRTGAARSAEGVSQATLVPLSVEWRRPANSFSLNIIPSFLCRLACQESIRDSPVLAVCWKTQFLCGKVHWQ